MVTHTFVGASSDLITRKISTFTTLILSYKIFYKLKVISRSILSWFHNCQNWSFEFPSQIPFTPFRRINNNFVFPIFTVNLIFKKQKLWNNYIVLVKINIQAICMKFIGMTILMSLTLIEIYSDIIIGKAAKTYIACIVKKSRIKVEIK